MADVEWDAEEFQPKGVSGGTATDRWDGEDEDDAPKDNWDEEDEEEEDGKGENDSGTKAVQVKKKKGMKEILLEKEVKRKAQLELKLQQEENEKPRTPEEIMADKARAQRMQEESDLELAKDVLGVRNQEPSGSELGSINPSSTEDFNEFEQLLKDKITTYEGSAHYVGFLEMLYRDLALGLEVEEIKKLGSVLTTLSNEKAKAQKSAKGKKKAKQKTTLNAGRDDNYEDYTTGAYEDLDDFM